MDPGVIIVGGPVGSITLTVITSESFLAGAGKLARSSVTMVIVAVPSKAGVGSKTIPSKALLISASKPVNVMALVPLPPLLKVSPVTPDKVRVPFAIVKVISSSPVPSFTSISLVETKLLFAALKVTAVLGVVICG